MDNIELFEKELESLINKYSIENYCDIPDFLLAKLIVTTIINTGQTFKTVLDWHGCNSVCHPASDNQRLQPTEMNPGRFNADGSIKSFWQWLKEIFN